MYNKLIIQARMGSTRLPNKVLMPLKGKSSLQHIVERCQQTKVDSIVVATTWDPSDDILVEECKRIGVDFYRGEVDDVLTRIYSIAVLINSQVDNVIRITADCPIIDPVMINELLDMHIAGDHDFTSNSVSETFPDGYDIHIIKMSALRLAWKTATAKLDREHVTPWILRQKFQFSFKEMINPENLAHWRMTVDYIEDFEVITELYEALYDDNNYFGFKEVYDYVKRNPAILEINKQHARGEAYKGLW